jgi:hypothetical protein
MNARIPCLICLALLALPGIARADDGATISEAQGADGKWTVAVDATYTGSGGGAYRSNIGIGTIRVTLPGIDASFAPTVTASSPSDGSVYQCRVDVGAYEVKDTGFVCETRGTPYNVQTLLFPNDVAVRIVTQRCYSPQIDDPKKPAKAEIWSADYTTEYDPDATYELPLTISCPPFEKPAQVVAPAKVKSTTCTVPNLRKATLKKAKAKLRKAKCSTRVKIKRVASTRIKKGLVMRQTPKAKKKIARTKRVTLVLSKGPARGVKKTQKVARRSNAT